MIRFYDYACDFYRVINGRSYEGISMVDTDPDHKIALKAAKAFRDAGCPTRVIKLPATTGIRTDRRAQSIVFVPVEMTEEEHEAFIAVRDNKGVPPIGVVMTTLLYDGGSETIIKGA